jgi:hypothetical protein
VAVCAIIFLLTEAQVFVVALDVAVFLINRTIWKAENARKGLAPKIIY